MGRKLIILLAALADTLIVPAFATEYELKWDTGFAGGMLVCVNAGVGFWYGNDFDVSTLNARYIDRVKIAASRDWPNGVWDGFRIALFDFDGVPGNMIWPPSGVPRFVKGSGSSEWDWCEFDVGWTLPAGKTAFVAAQEQFYLPPNCDPYVSDDDPTSRGHTWNKWPGNRWVPGSFGGRQNLMFRVILKGDTAVRPTSLGRVKALYR